MSESINQVKDHYRQAVEDAEAYRHHIDSLAASASRNLGNSVHKPMNPAAYHRAAGCGSRKPPIGSEPHWTSRYLNVVTAAQPNWAEAHQTLTELCLQNADELGNFSPPTVALFTAATGAILAKHRAPPPIDMVLAETGQRLAYISLVTGITRAYRPHAVNPERLRLLILSAMNVAATEAANYTGADLIDAEAVRETCDQHGRPRQQNAPHAALSQANQLANLALQHRITPPDNPIVRSLQELNASHGDAWMRRSAVACAHDIIPQRLHHYAPADPGFSPQHLTALSEVAASALSQAKAAHAIHPMTDHLQMIIDQPAVAIPAERQQQLAQSLDNMLRESCHWYTGPIDFDQRADPGAADFHLLNQGYNTLLLHHGRIMAVALRLEMPQLAQRRNAITATVAGTLNRRARKEHDAFLQHQDDDPRHQESARRRITTAAAIVAAMPDSIVHPQERHAIAQHDAAQHDRESK